MHTNRQVDLQCLCIQQYLTECVKSYTSVERTKYRPNIENIKWNFLINLQQLMSDHTKRSVL